MPPRRLVPWICLGLILATTMCFSPVEPASAGPATQRLPSEARWLSFGRSEPGRPTLILLSADPTAVEMKASLPGCWAEDVEVAGRLYTRLRGEGYGFGEEIGRPDLPVLRQGVEIPFGAKVALELVEATYEEHSLAELGLHPIYPLQAPVPKVPEARENAPFEMDRRAYDSGSLFPAAPISLAETYVVRGHRVQPIEVWPVAYDAAAGTVRLYSALAFRLQLTGSDTEGTRVAAERYASPLFEQRLSQELLNYNQGRPTVDFAPDAPVGYLIIATDAYSDAMQPFVTLKGNQGYDVTITELSDIPGGSSNTAIKAYIQDAYDTWPTPPSYVLLVGDTDTLPGWNSVSASEITDLYYGTMDGASDWHPDIGRGRISVRSAAQTSAVVDKYLAYASLNGDEAWLKWAAFIATCDEHEIAEGTHNYVIDTYTEPEGYSGIFPNNPQAGGDKLYCITYNADRPDVQASVNEGRWAVIYSGHGGHSGWEFYGSGDVQTQTSYGMFPFVASHACITGDFAVTEVYGEVWLREENKGALVFWGSSDSSFWGEDDVLERAMFDSLFGGSGEQPLVAEMTDAGLAAVEAVYAGSARYYWETYNILGDPALKAFLKPDAPSFTLDVSPGEHTVCAGSTPTSTVEIASLLGYSETVFLEAGPLPSGISVTFDPPSATAPFSAELALTVAADVPTGDYAIGVTATDGISLTVGDSIALQVVATPPASPVLSHPADGSVGQPLAPTLQWVQQPGATGYDLRLGPSPLFQSPLVEAGGITATAHALVLPLEGGRCYWWQVRSSNLCGAGEWAEPFHFATEALQASFFDDMEAGPGVWSENTPLGSVHWGLVEDDSHSATHAWHIPDAIGQTDARLWNGTPFTLDEGSHLSFWHRFTFDDGWDGGVIEILLEGQGTWHDLKDDIVAGGYNGTLLLSDNPLTGRHAWTGSSGGWTQVIVDLDPYAGQSVQIRWRMGCDSLGGAEGWYVDDVLITSPLPPNPSPAVLEVAPSLGSPSEQTPVQIWGSGFIETPAVALGQTWLLSVTQVSSTTLQAVVPAGLATGSYTLTLYNGDCQQALLPDAFTVGEVFRLYLPLVLRR